MTYRSDFSDPFQINAFGIITGTVVTQFPDIECQYARLMAYHSNIGSFFIGNGSSASLCVWELDAGDDTGWFGIDNLNKLWHKNGSGTSDYLVYWIER